MIMFREMMRKKQELTQEECISLLKSEDFLEYTNLE